MKGNWKKGTLALQNYEQQFNTEGAFPQIRQKKLNAPKLERSDMSPIIGTNMKLRNIMHITYDPVTLWSR